MNFHVFKDAVAKQFEKMKQGNLYRVDIDKDHLWDIYLNSFPEGTNNIYKERREYDCQCCKQFIRAVGNVVSIVDNKTVTIWDIEIDDPAYQAVADALGDAVSAFRISNIFLHYEKTAGTDKNFQQLVDQVVTWEHFFVNIGNKHYCDYKESGERLSDSRASYDVLYRALTEITTDAIDTVLELIAQGSLYRGPEFEPGLEKLKVLKEKFLKLNSSSKRQNFVWEESVKNPKSITRIRNSSIGTLLVNLSDGEDLEISVKAFETIVAPANYKRPTSLITKKMLDQAQAKITDLGLLSALERRYANVTDITANNILFADRDIKTKLSGNVFEELSESLPAPTRSFDKVEEIHIDNFIANVLPNVKTMEVILDNKHIANLVSLISPVDPTAGKLFKWDNNFSWTYNGEVTDSIKERVKKAGGEIEADLCCRLSWSNYDDLDLHMKEPNGYEIYYGNKSTISPCGGRLDVDMNAGHGQSREPVENIFYRQRSSIKEGTYELFVNNFCRRETVDVGFEVEIDFMGNIYTFSYPNALRDKQSITVATFKYSRANGVEFIKTLPSSTRPREAWGIKTGVPTKVNIMMLSPNYWDSKVTGNKHFFFMLEGCANPESCRGFFNEFLKDDLTVHRKVFEVVSSKMKTQPNIFQLSGVGFSSTIRNSLNCVVTGKYSRPFIIVF
jgi:hypothetical protein